MRRRRASHLRTGGRFLNQLNTELGDAESMRDLYNQFNELYNTLFINNEALLNQMISDAQITDQNTKVSGRTLSIIEGVLSAALYAAEDLASGGLVVGIGAIANLGETAVDAAVKKGTVSESSFHTVVADLWGQLSADFLAVQTANGNNETTILEDSGRSGATAALIASTGPDSLAWSPQSTPALVAALEPGFEIAAMQMLIPAKYSKIQSNPQYFQSNFDGANSPPSWDTYVEELGYGVWDEFYIGNIGDTSIFPGKQAIQNDIFDNGVSPTQFFNGLNGWNFNFNYEYSGWLAAGAIGCNSLLVSITNQSPDTVTLSATVAAHEGFLFGNSPRTLGPYATNVFGVQTEDLHGPDFDFSISGPNGSASFEVQQDYCLGEAGDIRYTNQGNSGQYQLSNLGDTTGSEAADIPGIQRVAVYNPSANQ